MFQNKAAVSAGARPTHTIPQDFCRIFAEDQTALYLLSLVLTADSEKAEQCFVADWKTPSPGNPVRSRFKPAWHASDQRALGPDIGGLLTSVLQLVPFERFVFVMSALEGYSLQECSTLSNCTKQEAVKGRARAMRHLALAESGRPTPIRTDKARIRAAQFLEPMHAS